MSNSNEANNKPKLQLEAVYKALEDPDTFATVLLTICLIQYGEDTFKVDPLVLFAWLEEDFGLELNEDNQNKLNAIITALTTDYFYNDLQTFKAICKTLTSGDPGIVETDLDADEVTVPEILWGIYEVSLCNDDEVVNTYKFNSVIKSFINVVLKNEPMDQTLELNPEEFNIIKHNCNEIKLQLMNLGIKNQYFVFRFLLPDVIYL